MLKNLFAQQEFTSISERRRFKLLNMGLILITFICALFSVINQYRGLKVLAVIQIIVLLTCIFLLALVRSRKNLMSTVSFIFVLLTCALGLTAFAMPRTHPTVFVWPLLAPMMAFFLLGKRKALPVCAVYTAFVLAIIIFRHTRPGTDIPMVALSNILVFLFCGAVMTYYFESTRQEFEDALLEDIDNRIAVEREKEAVIRELQKALAEVKVLSGLLPICSSCKKIRSDTGYWERIESYIEEHSSAQFSHSICPDCAGHLYPDIMKQIEEEEAKGQH